MSDGLLVERFARLVVEFLGAGSRVVVVVRLGGVGAARLLLVLLVRAVFVPVFAATVAAWTELSGPGLAGVSPLAPVPLTAISVGVRDELVLVRAVVAAVALALLEVVADLVLLGARGGVGAAAVAAGFGDGVDGSLEVLLDVVAFLPAAHQALDVLERELRLALAQGLLVEVGESDLDLRVSLRESEVLGVSERGVDALATGLEEVVALVLQGLLVLSEVATASRRVERHVGVVLMELGSRGHSAVVVVRLETVPRSEAVVLLHVQDEGAVFVTEDARDVVVDLLVGHGPELTLERD